MTYATLEQFQDAFQGDAALSAYGASDDVIAQRWLDTATARMDSAFVEADYAAPIDTSQAGVHQAALEALLAARCMDLALREAGFSVHVGEGRLALVGQRADDWLERLKGLLDFDGSGNLRRIAPSEHLPGLQRLGGGFIQFAGGPVKTQEQVDHGFAEGDAFALVGGTFVLADLAAGRLAEGIVVKVRSVSRFDAAYRTAGELAFPGHPYGSTPGERYLSADTAGLLVEERPADIAQVVLRVLSSSRILMVSQPAVPG